MTRLAILAVTLLTGAASAEESPYLFDVLAKGPYRTSWEKLMKEVQPTPDWLLRFSKDFDGVSFASRIEIFRPQEEYDITLNMLKVEINTPLTNEQFTLEQPAGAEVVHLDQPQSSLVVPVGQNQ